MAVSADELMKSSSVWSATS